MISTTLLATLSGLLVVATVVVHGNSIFDELLQPHQQQPGGFGGLFGLFSGHQQQPPAHDKPEQQDDHHEHQSQHHGGGHHAHHPHGHHHHEHHPHTEHEKHHEHSSPSQHVAVDSRHLFDQYEKSKRDWAPAMEKLNKLRRNLGEFPKLEWDHTLAATITEADFELHHHKFPMVVVKMTAAHHDIEWEKEHLVKRGLEHLFYEMLLHQHGVECDTASGVCKAHHDGVHHYPWAFLDTHATKIGCRGRLHPLQVQGEVNVNILCKTDADAGHNHHLFHINQVHNKAVQQYLNGKHHPHEGQHPAPENHIAAEEHHLVLAQLAQHGNVAQHSNDHHEAQKKSESSSSSSSSSSSESSESSSESDSESSESLEAKKGHHGHKKALAHGKKHVSVSSSSASSSSSGSSESASSESESSSSSSSSSSESDEDFGSESSELSEEEFSGKHHAHGHGGGHHQAGKHHPKAAAGGHHEKKVSGHHHEGHNGHGGHHGKHGHH